uniref:Reverse transcriptase domain-containing protein n=1 Tax=Tanacetum cinerariifolium TaxID=118510 RepID=A0A6L2P2S1_TANCI|nr:hypothetical protein [Tanacetum cinerariifolium]
MAALVIFVFINVSVRSVRTSFSRVILISSISVEVSVAQKVGAAIVALPVGVFELDTHSSSEADPSKSSLPPVFLALRYTSHHLDHFTFGSSSNHSSSGHSISGHSLSGHRPPDTIRFVPLSTMYPLTISKSSARDSSFELSAGPYRKRCRSPAATMTSSIHALRALVPSRVDLLLPRKRYRADATVAEVAVDKDVEAGVNACFSMEVDVKVYVEDGVEDEVKSSDKGTMEGVVDVVVGIDIPDGMLMLDVVENLEQIEEVVQDIYGHVIEIPLQRIMTTTHSGMTPKEIEELINQRVAEALTAYKVNRAAELAVESQSQNKDDDDNENGRGNGNRNREGNGNRNPIWNNKGVMHVACLPNNIQGNVISSEPTRLQDVVRIANNLMDQKLKSYAVKMLRIKEGLITTRRTTMCNNRRTRDRMLVGKVWQEPTQLVAMRKRDMMGLFLTTTNVSYTMKGC